MSPEDCEKARRSLNNSMRWLAHMVIEGESLRELPQSKLLDTVRIIYGYSGTLLREQERLPLA